MATAIALPLASLQLTEPPKKRPKTTDNLLDLNDDCLEMILNYLRPSDLISLRLTNTRFVPLFQLVGKRRFKRIRLDQEDLERMPLDDHLERYQAIAECARKLHLYHLDEDDFIEVIECFPELQQLYIRTTRLKLMAAIASFPTVKELYLDAGETSKAYLTALLMKFAPTLEVLHCHQTPRVDIGILPQLKELSIAGVWLGKKSKFWQENKTLRKLIVKFENDMLLDLFCGGTEVFHDFGQVRDNLRLLAAMPTLESLDWKGASVHNLRPDIMPDFNHTTMVEFEFNIGAEKLILPVLRKFGPQVKTLVMAAAFLNNRTIGRKALALMAERFPQLEALLFVSLDTYSAKDLAPIVRSCKGLKKLITRIDTPESCMQLIKQIPTLEELHDQNITKDDEIVGFPPEFNEWLRAGKRQVSISGCMFPEY